ncbi:hypothetical protein ACHHV8_18010 [Paenibacillus sp. TAB 01]|uniref:hypothetical protein n=1 Tax=Paenibacillus sp. TAB 01 TaxID=3368988 RepID=UPI003751FEC3
MFGVITGIVLTAAVGAAVLELPKLIKRRKVKEAVVYGLMFVMGTALCIITGNDNNLPSPFRLLVWVYKPVNDWIAAMFSEGG